MAEIDLIQQRIAETHARFRQANEQIEAAAHTLDVVGKVPFICECADPECMETVRLHREEYEDVREHLAASSLHPAMLQRRWRRGPASS